MLDMAKEKPRKTSQYSDEAQDAAMRANPYRGGNCCPMFGKLFPWCVILFFIVFPVWAAHHGISTDNLLVPVCAAIIVGMFSFLALGLLILLIAFMMGSR